MKFLVKNPDFDRCTLPEPVALEPIIPGEMSPNVVRISTSKKSLGALQSRKKMIYATIAVLSILVIYGLVGTKEPVKNPSEPSRDPSAEAGGGISHLPPDQQMIIKDTFNLARTHYTQGIMSFAYLWLKSYMN